MKRFLIILTLICGWLSSLALSPSGSLPVIYINTKGGAEITSKDNYLQATYYLDAKGAEGIESIGSTEAPDTLQIRGRGNYTWTGFDKKPYRLKLGKKQALMGMKKSKHFGLLAHADDDLAFLRNPLGFYLSRCMGLPWTPEERPIELVLNGDYKGLYFLTELIRVDKNRVDIVEQPDNITHPDSITGGWLVEIDNYDDPDQIQLQEGNGELLRVSYKTPEVLSGAQQTWLRDQFTAMDAAIYDSDKSSTKWEEYIDIDRLARFYVVQEIMDNAESFHGSCYMHRDMGADKKWMFGPVWDFGNSMHRGQDKYIHVDAPFGNTWIGEIYKFPAFRKAVKQVWDDFQRDSESTIAGFADAYAEKIAVAAESDVKRWPNYGCSDVADRKASMLRKIGRKIAWLRSQWGAAGISLTPTDTEELRTFGGGIFEAKGVSEESIRVVSIDGKEIGIEALGNGRYRIQAGRGIYIVTAGLQSAKLML